MSGNFILGSEKDANELLGASGSGDALPSLATLAGKAAVGDDAGFGISNLGSSNEKGGDDGAFVAVFFAGGGEGCEPKLKSGGGGTLTGGGGG